MTSELGETFNEHRKARQEKRAGNRASSAAYLQEHGIPFVLKNGGAHLIVKYQNHTVDFWPGTGKWISRCGKKGRGVRNLVTFIKNLSNDSTRVSS